MIKVSVSRCSVAGDAKWCVLLPSIDCQCFELVEDTLRLCPTAFQPASTQLEENLSYKQEFAVSCNISAEAISPCPNAFAKCNTMDGILPLISRRNS